MIHIHARSKGEKRQVGHVTFQVRFDPHSAYALWPEMGRSLAPTRVWAMVQIPGEDKNTQNCQEDWPTRPRSRETRQNVVYNRYVGIFAMGAIGPELIFEGNAKSEKTMIRKQLRAITRHTLAVHNDSGNTQLLGVKYDTWQ